MTAAPVGSGQGPGRCLASSEPVPGGARAAAWQAPSRCLAGPEPLPGKLRAGAGRGPSRCLAGTERSRARAAAAAVGLGHGAIFVRRIALGPGDSRVHGMAFRHDGARSLGD